MRTIDALKGFFALAVLWVVILIFATSSAKNDIGLALVCGWVALMVTRWIHGKYVAEDGKVEDVILPPDKSDPLPERIIGLALFIITLFFAASSVALTMIGLYKWVDAKPGVGIVILVILIPASIALFKKKGAGLHFVSSNIPNTPEPVPPSIGPSIRWFKGEVKGDSVVISFWSANGKKEITLQQGYAKFWSKYRDQHVEHNHCVSGFGVFNGSLEEQFDKQAEEGREYDFFVPNDPATEETLKDIPLRSQPIDDRKWIKRVREMGILDEVTVTFNLT